jgi:hypothetical protein
MGITITCFDPLTGQLKTIDAMTVGDSGSSIAQEPSLFARRINLSMADVMESIQEGRAAGFKPFNLYNSASPWDSAQ